MAPEMSHQTSTLTTYASAFCTILGIVSVILNVHVAFAVLLHRRKAMRNVFYIIVLHCAIVDFVRGVCLLLWCVPYLNIDYTLQQRTMLIKVSDSYCSNSHIHIIDKSRGLNNPARM
jgi:hypothetical protein